MADHKANANGRPRINAAPSKDFFIEMLTRDIGLSECILDLVDNSVHSLINSTNIDLMQNLLEGTKLPKIDAEIDINMSPTRFTVKDNCGGISIEDAKNHVFLLGNPNTDKTHAGLAVYGIGMKRAIFKIGRRISIASNTKTEEFRVDIDVDDWKSRPDDWYFDFAAEEKKKSARGGTSIDIRNLNQLAAAQFGTTPFRNNLISRLSSAFALFLKSGMRISVNDVVVEADIPLLGESKNVKAVRQRLKQDDVDILIMASVTPHEDRTPRGWYVFCNGRLVLEADQGRYTGWGENGHPTFQPKFNPFLGYVYFRSKDVMKLPWTTTKDNVQLDSPVYQFALAQMRVLNRPILNFLNNLYSDQREESEPEKKVLQDVKPVDPQKVAGEANRTFQATVKKPSDETLVSVQYKRSKKLLKKVRDALERSSMSASRIGEYTFDWFYDRNCE